MYTVGIFDDGISTCSKIEELILRYADSHCIRINTYVWFTGEGIIENLKRDMQIDILYLDIELVRISGIEVGEFIRNNLENRNMQIIYISGKDSYAKNLFRTQPMDFIIKPITEEKIKNSLELAIKIINKKNARYVIQQGKDFIFMEMGKIKYIMSRGRKIRVVMEKEEYEFYGKLSEESNKLSDDFISIHKSYVVNIQYIKKYTYEMVQMDDDSILTISRTHRKKIRDILLRNMNNV